MLQDALVRAAGDYLSRGLSIIALTQKTPNVVLHPTGLHSALAGAPESESDWDFIRRFFEHPATTGIGIVIPFPYVVVDIDGEAGAEQWHDIAPADWMPDRWVASTGRGLHLWYSCLTPTGTIKLGPQLDLKAVGGYVAAPPSLHFDASGDIDGAYEWLLPPGDDNEPPLEAPQPLLRIIEDRAFDLKGRLEAKEVRRRAWGPRYVEGDTVFYAQPGHDALIRAMEQAEEGNRNNMLHWVAATLAEEGGTDEEFEALEAAALKNGLEPVETRRTLRSARRAHG